MKRIRLFALVAALAVALMLILTPVAGIADAGDFSGGSDYGGGSDWGGSDYSYDDDDDYYSSGTYYSGGSGGGDSSGGELIIGAIVMIIVIYVMLKGRKGSSTKANRPAGASRTVLPMTIEDLKAKDPNFSEEAVKEKIGNLYIKMQGAWQNKDWEPMRADLTDALFNQMKSGVEAKKRNHQTNYVERIAILGVNLTGFGQDENHDIITAELRTRIVDYTVDDNTGAVISGSKTAEKFLTYEWTLVRTKDSRTPLQTKDAAKFCPSCGAPLDVNHSAQCPYCGTVITAASYDWTLNAIKGLAQQTSGK